MRILFILSLILASNVGTSIAQTQNHNYRGNLVKVNMTSKSASLSDTLGSWWDIYSEQSSGQFSRSEAYYLEHLKLTSGHSYLLKQSEGSMGPFIQQYSGANYIESEEQNKWRTFNSSGAGWDIIPAFFIQRTKLVPADSGCWLLNGSLGNSFLYNNDSLKLVYSLYGQKTGQNFAENLVFILGKVSDRYLAAFQKENRSYEYRLIDLSKSPAISQENSTVVEITGVPRIYNPNSNYERIGRISDDLYLIQATSSGVMFFLRFDGSNFTYIKPVSNNFGGQISLNGVPWEFRNNKLYAWSSYSSSCFAVELNLSDTTFIFEKEILGMLKTGGETGADRDLNYAAQIDGDTLRIFDMNKACYINSISIAGVKKPFRPIVDYPYVYLHQTLFEENSSRSAVEENNSTVKSYKLSAYPNPFNPVTTLEFNIPFAGHVGLKIYDTLGKEVTTLLNEDKKAGNYKVQFNATSLPSGVYLCRMNAGIFSMTKKIILLK